MSDELKESESDFDLSEIKLKQNIFSTVTPLSKYLAMVVFIVLPFIGVYVGYHYAPEKVVEVERVIEMPAEISQDEKNKIRLREALVYEVENRDKYTYDHVLDEPNGFDPYVYDPKSRDLDISGLSLTEKSFSQHISSVRFANTDRFENTVLVSGEFEYRHSGYDGGMWLVFKPDLATQSLLPWPSTSKEVYDWYFVMYGEDTEIVSLLESYCNNVCQEEMRDLESNKVLRFIGTAGVSSVSYEFENIGVGSASPLIWLYDLTLEAVENSSIANVTNL